MRSTTSRGEYRLHGAPVGDRGHAQIVLREIVGDHLADDGIVVDRQHVRVGGLGFGGLCDHVDVRSHDRREYPCARHHGFS